MRDILKMRSRQELQPQRKYGKMKRKRKKLEFEFFKFGFPLFPIIAGKIIVLPINAFRCLIQKAFLVTHNKQGFR